MIIDSIDFYSIQSIDSLNPLESVCSIDTIETIDQTDFVSVQIIWEFLFCWGPIKYPHLIRVGSGQKWDAASVS